MLIETAFNTPFGWLNMAFDEHYIYRCIFTDKPVSSTHPATKQSQLIESELDNYFNNCHHRFQLPLKPQGSVYQQRVWNALLVIPVGRTVTYGELAQTLQSSPRAIGQACKKNPLALFIPCHRVVGKTSQGGYMGRADALCYKTSLLNHEQVIV
ncbi:MAG: methylated-DNA--[protein]-cysteine S-methyltransferase [Legionella sp.]|nr:methylated-DNA--[protein]-cysteine S-methyltransferase [Legionella sp.]